MNLAKEFKDHRFHADASTVDLVKVIREMTGGGVDCYSFECVGLKPTIRTVFSRDKRSQRGCSWHSAGQHAFQELSGIRILSGASKAAVSQQTFRTRYAASLNSCAACSDSTL